MERFPWRRPDQKTIRELTKEPTEIRDVSSFKELFTILRKKGGLTGSDGTFYSAEELIKRVGMVREGKESLQVLTRSEGFRDKVSELLERERKIKTDLEEIRKVLKRVEGYYGQGSHDARVPSLEVAELLTSILNTLKQYPENERGTLIRSWKIDEVIKDINRVFHGRRIAGKLYEIITQLSQIK